MSSDDAMVRESARSLTNDKSSESDVASSPVTLVCIDVFLSGVVVPAQFQDFIKSFFNGANIATIHSIL